MRQKPLCLTAFLLGLSLTLAVSVSAVTITGTRTFSQATYVPGETLDVTLDIVITGTPLPTGVIVTEIIPGGWEIINANPNYDKNNPANTYKWVKYGTPGVSSFSIQYTVQIPADAAGVQTFDGTVQIDPDIFNITGDTVVAPASTALAVTPDRVHFGLYQNSATVTVKNMGGAALNWTSAVQTHNGINGWLTVVPNSGNLAGGAGVDVNLQINRARLTSGSHTATVTFTGGGSNITVRVSVIIDHPSPVTNLAVIPLLGTAGNGRMYLLWKNPACFTGTIIFRKNALMASNDVPVDGTVYLAGSFLEGGAVCVFKDDTDADTNFVDTGLNLNTVYHYRVYGFDDSVYPSYYPVYAETPAEGYGRPMEVGAEWLNINPAVGLDATVVAPANLFGFGINIVPNALSQPANVQLGYVDSLYTPAHPGLVGFANTYLLASDIRDVETPIRITLPIRQSDLDATGVKYNDLHVYHWPDANNSWEDVPIVAVTEDSVTVEVSHFTGNDYFSLGIPIVIPGRDGGGCFIATAAFGSPLAGQIEILKVFRDRYLLTNAAGTRFVTWYYRRGPAAAEFITRHPGLKLPVRVLLYPLVGLAWLLLTGLFWWLVLLGTVPLFLISKKGDCPLSKAGEENG